MGKLNQLRMWACGNKKEDEEKKKILDEEELKILDEEKQKILDEEKQKILEDETKDKELPMENSNIKNKLKGVILAIFLVLSVGLSAVCVPLLERKIPDFELNLFRCIFAWITTAIGLVIKTQLPNIPKSEIAGVIVLTTNSLFAAMTVFTSVSFIPLSYYKSLFFTFAIFGGLLLFPKCLQEKTDLRSLVIATLCVIGVILSIQPEFIFTWKKNLINNSTLYQNGTTPNLSTSLLTKSKFNTTILGCILACCAGVADTVHIIILKRNPFLQENLLSVLFWVSGLSVVLCLIIMLLFEKPVMPQNTKQILLISGHTVSYVLGWIILMLATKYISGNTINIIYSTLVVFMLIPQYTLLKHILPGNHNWMEVCGSVLVFIGAATGSILDVVKGK